MKRYYLGELEELILLTIAVIGADAYGVSISRQLEQQTGRLIDFSTVHTTLKRLENKGFLNSKMGGATRERGGRRKRFFSITSVGYKALHESQGVRNKLWSQVPLQYQIKNI
jgi:PadR family transcriptional regulator PadR